MPNINYDSYFSKKWNKTQKLSNTKYSFGSSLISIQNSKNWCSRRGLLMDMGINYFLRLLSHPPSQKPCLCKPSCASLRAQDVSAQGSFILPAEVCCISRSRAVGKHKSASHCEVIPREESPWWVLQENYKLQPGLTQAVYRQPQLLVHSLLGSWAKPPRRPLPTAQKGQREQRGFLIRTCPFSQKRD